MINDREPYAIQPPPAAEHISVERRICRKVHLTGKAVSGNLKIDVVSVRVEGTRRRGKLLLLTCFNLDAQTLPNTSRENAV